MFYEHFANLTSRATRLIAMYLWDWGG